MVPAQIAEEEVLELPVRVDDLRSAADQVVTSRVVDEGEMRVNATECHVLTLEVDRELSRVDALLADSGIPRFAARRVASVGSAKRMAH